MAVSPTNLSYQLEAGSNQPTQSLASEKKQCGSCGQFHLKTCKYCTSCGQPSSNVVQPVNSQPTPIFAQVHNNQPHRVPKELQAELNRLLVAVARERLFLYFHWLVFFGVHCLGFYIAYKMYQDFAGDETSKILVATPSLFFLNVSAFMALPIIKTTRFQIRRLKEQLTYIHYRIEYRDIW